MAIKETLRKWFGTAKETASELSEKAQPHVEKAVEKTKEAAEKAKPHVEKGVEKAKETASELSEKAKDKVSELRGKGTITQDNAGVEEEE